MGTAHVKHMSTPGHSMCDPQTIWLPAGFLLWIYNKFSIPKCIKEIQALFNSSSELMLGYPCSYNSIYQFAHSLCIETQNMQSSGCLSVLRQYPHPGYTCPDLMCTQVHCNSTIASQYTIDLQITPCQGLYCP